MAGCINTEQIQKDNTYPKKYQQVKVRIINNVWVSTNHALVMNLIQYIYKQGLGNCRSIYFRRNENFT